LEEDKETLMIPKGIKVTLSIKREGEILATLKFRAMLVVK